MSTHDGGNAIPSIAREEHANDNVVAKRVVNYVWNSSTAEWERQTSSASGDGAILDGASSAVKATVLDYTNSNPLAVRLTDTGGDYVAAGAGTQYTEDAAAAANPIGSALNLIRDDARGGSLTTTDGDNVAARGNNKGELYVKTTDSDALLTTIDADTGSIATSSSAIDTNAGATGDAASTQGGTGTISAKLRLMTTQLNTLDGNTNGIETLLTGIATYTDSSATALQTIDNAVSGAGFNITQFAGTGAAVGSGTATGALRVELPTNGTGVIATVGAVTAITNALPAGTNAIGKLAANSGVDIGDVDVTSIAAGTNAIGRVGHDITGIGHGVTTVTTAGTDVALAGSTACKEVTIQAQTDNTSSIAVGASGVDATVATGTGILLGAGDSITLNCDNLADIFIDSLVNGEGVRYVYLT